MAHLPGHKYVGPGSDLSKKDKPVDDDDRTAYEHDLAYARAKSASEIRDADLHAIQSFAKDSLNHPHAVIGAVGLGVKYIAESVVGVQYPRLPQVCQYGGILNQGSIG